MKPEEFTALVEGMLAEDYGELSLGEFGAIMDALNEALPEVRVRIGVKVENGNVIAYGPNGRLLPNKYAAAGETRDKIRRLLSEHQTSEGIHHEQ